MATSYNGKYIEVTDPTFLYLKKDREFLVRIRDKIKQDPKRRAYIRRSLDQPGKYTVYANIPDSYFSNGYKIFYDENQIVRV